MTTPETVDDRGNHPELATSRPGRSWVRVVGRVITYLTSGALNVVALLCVLFLWRVWLSGEYRTDHDLLSDGGLALIFFAWVGGVSAGLSLLVTGIAAALRLIPRWVCAVPAVLLMAIVIANRAMSDVYGQAM